MGTVQWSVLKCVKGEPTALLMCEVWDERENGGKHGPNNFGRSSWKAGVAFYCHLLRGDTGERGVGEVRCQQLSF